MRSALLAEGSFAGPGLPTPARRMPTRRKTPAARECLDLDQPVLVRERGDADGARGRVWLVEELLADLAMRQGMPHVSHEYAGVDDVSHGAAGLLDQRADVLEA